MDKLEELKAKQAELTKKIMEMDSAGTTGEELDKLKKEHEAVTAEIEEQPNADEQKH